jgi:Ser/Thr protein kinase RdoA (MazF antagonist)
MSEPSADRGTIDAVLRAYRRVLSEPVDCRPVDRPGFSGAFVARVETATGAFCLRSWPPSTADRERILPIHELLGHVRSRGVDYVAVPLVADHGETLVSVAGRLWQVEPWLPGAADFWSRPSEARLTAAFGALARFHLAARDFRPSAGPTSLFAPAPPGPAPTVLDRIERMHFWTPDRRTAIRERLARFSQEVDDDSRLESLAERILADFERSAQRIAHEMRAAAYEPVPLQPCLRDVWHDHVLFQGDAVSGLIDPSAARTDTVAADLSRLAGSLIADDRRAWSLALDAYRSVRDLSPAEEILVGVLDRSGVVLSGMTWLERWHFGGVPLSDRALDRLERIAARLAKLDVG